MVELTAVDGGWKTFDDVHTVSTRVCSGTFSETLGGPVILMALETLKVVTTCLSAGVSPVEVIAISLKVASLSLAIVEPCRSSLF